MPIKVTDPKRLAVGIAVVIASIIGLVVGGRMIGTSVEVVSDRASSTDAVSTTSLGPKGDLFEHNTGGIHEKGVYHATITRPCTDGRIDVSRAPKFIKDSADSLAPNKICGVLYDEDQHNLLTYEGQQHMLNCYFKATGCPTASGLYIAVATSTPIQTSTLATSQTQELNTTVGAYSRKQVTAWTVSANASSNNTANNTTAVTWTATATWPTATGMFVANAASGLAGVMLSYSAFSGSRTLQTNDVLNVTYTLTLQ